MLEQTKRVKDKLLAAGLRRKDFRVRTERVYRGKFNGYRCWEYGDVNVTVRHSESIIRCAFELANQGFEISLYQFEDGRLNAHLRPLRYNSRPGVFLMRQGVLGEYGIHKEWKLTKEDLAKLVESDKEARR